MNRDERDERIVELEAWVNDLQSGMYVNCVYCGHRYGPNETTPVSMADALKEHIEHCPKHPMSALKAERDDLRRQLEQARLQIAEMKKQSDCLGDLIADQKGQLEQALQQYANSENWGYHDDDDDAMIHDITWRGAADGPDIANAVLDAGKDAIDDTL